MEVVQRLKVLRALKTDPEFVWTRKRVADLMGMASVYRLDKLKWESVDLTEDEAQRAKKLATDCLVHETLSVENFWNRWLGVVPPMSIITREEEDDESTVSDLSSIEDNDEEWTKQEDKQYQERKRYRVQNDIPPFHAVRPWTEGGRSDDASPLLRAWRRNPHVSIETLMRWIIKNRQIHKWKLSLQEFASACLSSPPHSAHSLAWAEWKTAIEKTDSKFHIAMNNNREHLDLVDMMRYWCGFPTN